MLFKCFEMSMICPCEIGLPTSGVERSGSVDGASSECCREASYSLTAATMALVIVKRTMAHISVECRELGKWV